MKFVSYQIKGRGEGKLLGFPTINLKIPVKLKIEEGIYAVKVKIGTDTFLGAMHYGPIPVYKIVQKNLEIFLIVAKKFNTSQRQQIEIETIKKIRDIKDFPTPQALKKQIQKDVEEIIHLTQ